MRIRGIIPPLITPFEENGEVDEELLKGVVDFLVSKGVNAFFINGSYSSGPMMTDEERMRTAQVVIERVSTKVPVINMVGTPSTYRTLKLAKHSQDVGADAVSSLVPYYYSSFAYGEKNVLLHFRELVDAVEIPVYLYNNPRTTGYRVSPALLGDLVEAGVKGMKDSGGDIVMFWDYLKEAKKRDKEFNGAIGTPSLLLPAYMAGSRACVAGSANVFPEVTLDLFKALEEGRLDDAIQLQQKTNEIRKLMGIAETRAISCYAVLKMRGIDPGTVRKPWTELSERDCKQLRNELTELGLL